MAAAEIPSDRCTDELEALQAIYGPENVQGNKSSVEVTVDLDQLQHALQFRFSLPPSYPEPHNGSSRVTCRVSTRAGAADGTLAAQAAANAILQTHVDGEILFGVISAAQAAYEAFVSGSAREAPPHEVEASAANTKQPVQELESRATRIHHMRDRRAYLKTLASWASELEISGGVFRSGRHILLVTQGSPTQVTEFFQRYRTCPVDVDSKGRKCKEK